MRLCGHSKLFGKSKSYMSAILSEGTLVGHQYSRDVRCKLPIE